MIKFHSLNQIRRNLAKSIPDRGKREFIAGYLEGHAERFGSRNKISPRTLSLALKKLETHSEAGATPWGQVTPKDVSKIREHFENKNPDKI